MAIAPLPAGETLATNAGRSERPRITSSIAATGKTRLASSAPSKTRRRPRAFFLPAIVEPSWKSSSVRAGTR
jgi:hypothetical protein